MRLLESSPKQFYEQHIPNIHEITFSEYLSNLFQDKKIKPSKVIINVCVSKTYAYQVINGERIPGRDIILRIALTLKLSISETQKLLTYAGKGILYPKFHRDACILFCLRQKKSLYDTNIFLENEGEMPL